MAEIVVTSGGSVVSLGVVNGRNATDAADTEIFARVYPRLHRFACVVRPRGVDADDLVQETVARTLSVRPLADLDDPLAYLRTAMVRVAANLRRSARRAQAREERLDRTGFTRDPYPSDLADLMRLAPQARAVLFLTIVEDQPYAAVAPIVGCSEEAARAMASRARRELHRTIADEMNATEAS
jgi:RNA polymerase sigma-70 factor (ECF subfamily)